MELNNFVTDNAIKNINLKTITLITLGVQNPVSAFVGVVIY